MLCKAREYHAWSRSRCRNRCTIGHQSCRLRFHPLDTPFAAVLLSCCAGSAVRFRRRFHRRTALSRFCMRATAARAKRRAKRRAAYRSRRTAQHRPHNTPSRRRRRPHDRHLPLRTISACHARTTATRSRPCRFVFLLMPSLCAAFQTIATPRQKYFGVFSCFCNTARYISGVAPPGVRFVAGRCAVPSAFVAAGRGVYQKGFSDDR